MTTIDILIVGRVITIEREINERNKENMAKIKQRKLRAIT